MEISSTKREATEFLKSQSRRFQYYCNDYLGSTYSTATVGVCADYATDVPNCRQRRKYWSRKQSLWLNWDDQVWWMSSTKKGRMTLVTYCTEWSVIIIPISHIFRAFIARQTLRKRRCVSKNRRRTPCRHNLLNLNWIPAQVQCVLTSTNSNIRTPMHRSTRSSPISSPVHGANNNNNQQYNKRCLPRTHRMDGFGQERTTVDTLGMVIIIPNRRFDGWDRVGVRPWIWG